jgi:hypothetical protein
MSNDQPETLFILLAGDLQVVMHPVLWEFTTVNPNEPHFYGSSSLKLNRLRINLAGTLARPSESGF